MFLSSTDTQCRLDHSGQAGVWGRGTPGRPHDQGIMAALAKPPAWLAGAQRLPSVDRTLARAIVKAVSESGIRPSHRSRRVSDYELRGLLAEGDGWQDFEGVHVSAGVQRRIRIYPFASGSGEQDRGDLIRAALREFQILEGITHPGIVRLHDFKETELGPALIFEHDPKAMRLDFFLRDRTDRLGMDLRLALLRQLAEVLDYAHGRRLYHRALAPQAILVRDPDAPLPRLQVMSWHTAARETTAGATSARATGTQHLERYIEEPSQVYLAPEAMRPDIAAGPHMDVFSLGAIAFHLFTGRPQASRQCRGHATRLAPGLRRGSPSRHGCRRARRHRPPRHAPDQHRRAGLWPGGAERPRPDGHPPGPRPARRRPGALPLSQGGGRQDPPRDPRPRQASRPAPPGSGPGRRDPAGGRGRWPGQHRRPGRAPAAPSPTGRRSSGGARTGDLAGVGRWRQHPGHSPD